MGVPSRSPAVPGKNQSDCQRYPYPAALDSALFDVRCIPAAAGAWAAQEVATLGPFGGLIG